MSPLPQFSSLCPLHPTLLFYPSTLSPWCYHYPSTASLQSHSRRDREHCKLLRLGVPGEAPAESEFHELKRPNETIWWHLELHTVRRIAVKIQFLQRLKIVPPPCDALRVFCGLLDGPLRPCDHSMIDVFVLHTCRTHRSRRQSMVLAETAKTALVEPCTTSCSKHCIRLLQTEKHTTQQLTWLLYVGCMRLLNNESATLCSYRKYVHIT